jgi:hypothetical protein
MLSRLLSMTPPARSARATAATTTKASRRESGRAVQAPEPGAPRVPFDFSKVSIFPGGRVLQANPPALGTSCAAPVPLGAERALAAHPAEPLPESLRAEAEQRFGLPLDDVRIHQGAEASRFARAAGARAFTLGRDLVFGSGQYDRDRRQDGRCSGTSWGTSPKGKPLKGKPPRHCGRRSTTPRDGGSRPPSPARRWPA